MEGLAIPNWGIELLDLGLGLEGGAGWSGGTVPPAGTPLDGTPNDDDELLRASRALIDFSLLDIASA